ncbi:alpha-mannosidase [Paenibacillus sp. y28]|uniref:alpha-mannosidase n=1 Tax=Paenibacillus sp. y28 TaxID=3129110 RepID=UPI0030158CDD
MLWTKEKLTARIKDLEPFRYRDELRIEGMKCKPDPEGAIGAYPPQQDDSWKEIRVGEAWTGRDTYLWLSFECEIPAAWHNKKIVGRFDFGQTGVGNNSGFESLLFLNGAAYQGVDSNHQEVFLPAELTGKQVQFTFRLWSGLNGYDKAALIDHRLSIAGLCWLDEASDDLYYSSRAVLDTVKLLDENRPEHHELLKALDRAFLRIDWSRPGSEAFYTSVAEARDLLNSQLDAMPKQHPVTVRCIGHTHIDVAWLWQLKHTREKSARSFSTVLRLMELFPDYVFLQTQPQLYDYIQSDYPELYKQIQERVKEGRWEAGGAMWLEADCNLTSGESLVRQMLYGTQFFREQFGVECRYLWLPDVFGYSWALPQILRKSGIDMFMTTKISWNQYNRMPHDTFRWKGIDGSEVLTHFITTPDPGSSEGAFYYTYNGSVTPESVQGIWEGYRDKEINQELLLSYGYGDGGGGVNREMLELRRRLEKMPGLPNVTTGRADEYFEQLKQQIAETDRYVHTWDGELYLELHRGTYTSQAYNKRANRKLELFYREAEWLSVLGSLQIGNWSSYPQASLYEGWKIILRNQFHDIIPGSSIGEVYEDCRREYAEAYEIGQAAWSRAAYTVSGEAEERGDVHNREKEYAFTVFNSASWERDDMASIPLQPGMEQGDWFDADGGRLAAQLAGAEWHVRVKRIPPMGYTTIYFVSGPWASADQETASPFRSGAREISTPYYHIEWNEQGHLVRIYDKTAGRNVLAEGEAGNVLQVFEDKPKGRHEAWDIDIFYQEKMRVIDQLQAVSVDEVGPERAVVSFRWMYGRSVISQQMVVYASQRRIDFVTKADWHEQRQLLKAAFPVNVRSTEATYDIQFGNVKRPTHWNTSWDYARFESVGHQWADLSERGYGVSLLNDCKYGYDIKGHVMRLSLIKAALVPDPQADQGEHAFTYALYPHAGDWYDGGTVQAAWSLNAPLQAVSGKPSQTRFSLAGITADHVMIDAVKKAENSNAMMIRLHEFAGKRGEVRLTSDADMKSWQETDLLERPEDGSTAAEGPVVFSIQPYEIKTFLVVLNEA